MARKVRSDIQIGNLEKKLGLKPGAIRNPNGSDARSNKKLGTLRKEALESKIQKAKPAKPKKSTTILKRVKKTKANSALETVDQKLASKRTVKSNPKISIDLAKKVSAALKKSSKK